MYTVDVDLDGEAYTLRFLWSPRAACWLLDVRDDSGIAVVLGKPCVVGNLLTLGIGRPAGQLTIIGDRDPQRFDWGTRCKLVYLTAADVEALV
jgi:hypothetical protein